MAMLIAVVLAAVAFVVTPAGATGVASISMADCDADGRTDFTIDTTRYRARLLSSTGRLAEFYLKVDSTVPKAPEPEQVILPDNRMWLP